jgi:hypothetical protein
MRETGRQKAVGHRKTRSLFQRSQQICCSSVKLLIEEMSRAQTGARVPYDYAITGA